MRPNVIYPPDDGSGGPRRIASARQFPIFCMLYNRAWEDVVKRAKSHPSDILLQDEATGNTPLHEACRLDPPADVIVALQATSRVKNDLGATPLHIAASHRCSAEALGVLLDCASQLGVTSPTTDLSNMERAPIHYACMSFRGLEIEAFMLLLDRTLKDGFITIGDAREPTLGFEDFDDDEFYDSLSAEDKPHEKLVLNVISMKDSQGQTPLALLFRRYRQRVRSVISTIDGLRNENKGAPEQAALISAMTVHGELGELWEKARRIVTRLTEARLEREGTTLESTEHQIASPGAVAERYEAAKWAAENHRAGNPTDDDVLPVYVDVADRESNSSPVCNSSNNKARQFRIVHASVGLIGYGCPPEMIRLALSIHPHQVREMDEEGNLPLHIAVKASSFLGTSDEATKAMHMAVVAAASEISDDASLLSDAMSFFSSATVSQTTNPFDKVIKILLQQYPEAAKIPQGESGQLPLILAVETGRRTWEDGIRTLLYAYPPALHNKKVIEPELYPSVLVLVTNSSDAPSDTDFGPRPSFRSKQIRRDNCTRTILYELLRSKPEWLTPEGREQGY